MFAVQLKRTGGIFDDGTLIHKATEIATKLGVTVCFADINSDFTTYVEPKSGHYPVTAVRINNHDSKKRYYWSNDQWV